jgi:hypothetical protein
MDKCGSLCTALALVQCGLLELDRPIVACISHGEEEPADMVKVIGKGGCM